MSESTMCDVLTRLDEQEAELRALRRRLEGSPGTRHRRTQLPHAPRRATGRRRLALATVLVALVTLTPLSLAAADFTDLNPGSVHNADINAIADAGITLGCEANARYCPDDFVTREQMASFLARAAGLGTNAPVANARTAQTAGTIANQANAATIAATSANAPNTIALRDDDGNFSAGTITGNLTGTASNATNAVNATNATNAVNATTATTADDANAVDGKSADELIRLVGAIGGEVILTGAYQALVSVDIVAPAGGFVQVTGTLYAIALQGCPCLIDYRLIDLTTNTPQPYFFTLPVEELQEGSGAASLVFAVPAGSHTFAIQARIGVSAGAAAVSSDADVVALYAPFGGTGQAGTGEPGSAGPGTDPADTPTKRRPQR